MATLAKFVLFTLIIILVLCFGHHDSMEQNSQDNACGPKCLRALISLDGIGLPEVSEDCIYELIGKPANTVTTLGDIKDAAQQLGFNVNGYKLTIHELSKHKGYSILPVGDAEGNKADPLHFVLVKEISGGVAKTINTETLDIVPRNLVDLRERWNGYALLFKDDVNVEKFHKTFSGMNCQRNKIGQNRERWYREIKDFGKVDNGSRLKHIFFINETSDKAKPKIVQKDCGCTFAKIQKRPTGGYDLTIKLSVNKGGWQESYVGVQFEPESDIRFYALRAYGNSAFVITPKKAQIEVPNGGKSEYPVKIDYFTEKDVTVDFVRIESKLPRLNHANVTKRCQIDGNSQRFIFDIPLTIDATDMVRDAKVFRDDIVFVFVTDGEEKYLSMETKLLVGTEMYRLVPDKLFIMVSNSSDKVIKQAEIRFLTQDIPSSLIAKSELGLPLDIQTSKVSSNSFRIEVCLKHDDVQGLKAGLHRDKIIITPSGVKDSMTIDMPVSLYVRKN